MSRVWLNIQKVCPIVYFKNIKISSIFQVAVSEINHFWHDGIQKFEYMCLNMNLHHISRTLYTNRCDNIMLVYLGLDTHYRSVKSWYIYTNVTDYKCTFHLQTPSSLKEPAVRQILASINKEFDVSKDLIKNDRSQQVLLI